MSYPCIFSLIVLLTTSLQFAHADTPLRPVAAYSIVARDVDSGEIGVAVQSHRFSVGTLVSWAEAGVGAVAT